MTKRRIICAKCGRVLAQVVTEKGYKEVIYQKFRIEKGKQNQVLWICPCGHKNRGDSSLL